MKTTKVDRRHYGLAHYPVDVLRSSGETAPHARRAAGSRPWFRNRWNSRFPFELDGFVVEVGGGKVGKLNAGILVPGFHGRAGFVELFCGFEHGIVGRRFVRRSMGQYGFNFGRTDEFPDGKTFRVASHQQSRGPMGIEAAVVQALYASDGVRKAAVHHEVVVHAVVARGQARGEDYAVNEF